MHFCFQLELYRSMDRGKLNTNLLHWHFTESHATKLKLLNGIHYIIKQSSPNIN